MAHLTNLNKTWQARWQMRSSNSAKEENCKNNNFVKEYATEQVATAFPGAPCSVVKIAEFKSDQILHVGRTVQTAIGENQIHLIDISINKSLERI